MTERIRIQTKENRALPRMIKKHGVQKTTEILKKAGIKISEQEVQNEARA